MRDLMRKSLFLLVIFCGWLSASAQQAINKRDMGLIIGNILDTPSNKALSNVTVSLLKSGSPTAIRSTVTDKNGGFEMDKIPFGVYSLQFTTIGYAPFSIDSIRIRSDRFDFNLGDIKLSQKASEMAEVVVYAEKP